MRSPLTASRLFRSSFAAAVVALAFSVPRASQAQNTSLFFTGNCIDCALASANPSSPYQVNAILTVRNWAPEANLTLSDFVSFQYMGSNLLDPYYVHEVGGPGMTGYNNYVIENFYTWNSPTYTDVKLEFGVWDEGNYYDGLFWAFVEGDYSHWETCASTETSDACSMPADYGDVWSLQPGSTPTHPVPEPATLALVATGFALIGYRCLRRRTV